MFHLEPPPEFQGLHPNKPLRVYTRHLPHWRQNGATYFVTFRLADALPQEKLAALKQLRLDWETNLERQEVSLEELIRKAWQTTEHWLDQGLGSCVLRDPQAQRIMAEAFSYYDGKQYETGAYVIMPNHVHWLVHPLGDFELEDILQGRKRKTSREINRMLGKKGTLWQEESFDRLVRDAEHLWACLQYIGRNPRKAQLPQAEFIRWVRPEWITLGWDFADG